MIGRLATFLDRERRLFQQSRELAKLRTEVEALRAQNDKINRAMRRCLTCEYRLEVIGSE